MTVRKSPTMLWFWRRYVRWKLRRGLDGVRIDGLFDARASCARGPVVLAANHVAFWDGLLATLLDELLEADTHVLMDERHLKRLQFLKPLGGMPLSLTDSRLALSQIKVAASCLQSPGSVVLVFPQGKQTPHHLRPLGFQSGVSRLVREPGIKAIPVAIAYYFKDSPCPHAWVRLGSPVSAPRRELSRALETSVAMMLDAMDLELRQGGLDAPCDYYLDPVRVSPESGIGARLLGAKRR